MPMNNTVSQRIIVRRLSLWTLVKLSYVSCLGFCVAAFALALLLGLVGGPNVVVAPDMSAASLSVWMLGLVAVWPAIFGTLLGLCGWLTLTIASRFFRLEIELIEDETASREGHSQPGP